MTWMKKKASPSIHNITTVEEAERILSAEPKVVLALLDSLVVCNFQNPVCGLSALPLGFIRVIKQILNEKEKEMEMLIAKKISLWSFRMYHS